MRRGTAILSLALTVALPLQAGAQSSGDTVRVVAGPQYAARGFHRWLFGTQYRDLWTTPIHVPTLDLARFDGGLTATKKGGGQQTRSLHFDGRDGGKWVFRTVAKDPAPALAPRFRHSGVVLSIVRDQISAAHPVGALIVPPLIGAVGIPHATPRLVLMPDDERLGEFRKEFAGQLGLIEEYPDEGSAAFGRPDKVIDTGELRQRLDASAEDRVDANAFLAARLVDFVIGDWDRHEGQWRWARLGDGEAKPVHRWAPIPRDRDQAFSRFEGVVASIVRHGIPKFVAFDERYPSLAGLTMNAADLDRRLLAGLDRATWDTTIRAVQSALSDSIIDAALTRVPAAYAERTAPLGHMLRMRRDSLAGYADRYYRRLAHAVDVHATDAADQAEVRRAPDGSVTVALSAAAGLDEGPPHVAADRAKGDAPSSSVAPSDRAEPYFFRRFDPRETDEVRLYLHGGADTVNVMGPDVDGVLVRIILQGRSDTVTAGALPREVRVYRDADGPTPYGPDTLLDRRPWIRSGTTFTPPTRDDGRLLIPRASVRYDGDFGLASGLGVAFTTYGFRQLPWATRTSFGVEHSTRFDALRASAEFETHRERSRLGARGAMQVSGLEHLWFAGFGNATPRVDGRVHATEYRVDVAATMALARGASVAFGPTLRYTRADVTRGGLAGRDGLYGGGNFGRVGLALQGALPEAVLDSARAAAFGMSAGAELVPALWHVRATYGNVHGEVRAALRVPVLARSPVLALRAGGRRVWGPYPFEDASYVGGESTLRGWELRRFAGDGAAWGGAELRLPLLTVTLLVPLDIGIFGLADAGRVFVSGEDDGTWHTGMGGGLWLGLGQPDQILSFAIADGAEATRVYLRAGFAF